MWQRLMRVWTEFSAHYTWHATQPDYYFAAYPCDSVAVDGTWAVPEHDFIECPWCHKRYERECGDRYGA